MQYTTTITQKGQATIPAPIRKSLGIKPKSKITFELSGKKATILPVKDFLLLKGSLKSDKKFDIEAMDKAVERQIVNEYAQKAPRR
ncbi:hypothetical protein A3J17_01265 [Candidatus Curtissbacteria bacterium RIFCSPLOWO2_02_FULL_40_11]|uniref:SpoVT-AbrB domain-containing protein n=2 Tax=Candidatus Curtissiibacteriota TaxID=1752717 RepID=A0A1F5GBA4_9BACT|nr:MAG: hypothetical protein A3D04_03515 [Candidatus Curtissbacteria bacterium RIFCSPHIGHO2_02_FULL_40_16b]OGE00852.1 MAG: hypothetical protein A3J17_01265 [Candidatus Curtissbacteria bacterium RIFCSPLOWO2_02_FULL_40_11]OGE14040.1 MAG: hypothetical protein A3G14_03420 [Candidatus Curtissbacteria bacterium RIFCSPLOWO2_12_FULL_38_9]